MATHRAPLLLYPRPSSTPAFTNVTINSGGASIDRLAFSFQMPPDVTDTLTHICFRYGLRTGTPVAHDIGLQGVDASGNPDGTWKGGASPNKGTFTPPADATWDATWREIALSNSYATARGEIFYIVLEPTGTPDASNNSSFTRHISHVSGFPRNYVMTDGGAWTPNSNYPVVAVKSATRVYGFPVVSAFDTNMTTAGHRQVNKLTLPAGSGDTFQVSGLLVLLQGTFPGTSLILGIWDGAGAVVTAITVDADVFISGIVHEVRFDDAPVTLNYGTAYYYGLERVDATSGSRIPGLEVNAAADMEAYPFGTSCHGATWNGTSWTDVATRRHICSPILEDVTEPTASDSGAGSESLILGGGGLIKVA